MDGITIADAGLSLNGGTITTDGSSEGEPANLNLDGAVITYSSGDTENPPKVNGGLRRDKTPRPGHIGMAGRAENRGTYGRGEEIVLSVRFRPPVTVTGTPRLKLLVGEGSQSDYNQSQGQVPPGGQTTRYADYDAARSQPDWVMFSYTVQAEDEDRDGVVVPHYETPISLNGGTIVIRGGTTRADLSTGRTTSGPCDYPSEAGNACKVYGGSGRLPWDRPEVSRLYIGAAGANVDTFMGGDEIDVFVYFRQGGPPYGSEPLRVTGTPQLGLTIGSRTRQASYAGFASPSLASRHGITRRAALKFSYTVQASDLDVDGISIAANALTLNGGTITRASDATVAASLSHPAFTDGQDVFPTRKVYGRLPLPPPPPRLGTLRVFEPLGATGSFSRLGDKIQFFVYTKPSVSVTGTPRLKLLVGEGSRWDWLYWSDWEYHRDPNNRAPEHRELGPPPSLTH